MLNRLSGLSANASCRANLWITWNASVSGNAALSIADLGIRDITASFHINSHNPMKQTSCQLPSLADAHGIGLALPKAQRKTNEFRKFFQIMDNL